MISIKKESITKPNILKDNWISAKLLEIKYKPRPGEFVTSKYNDNDVRNALNQLYHNKCAYCEGKAQTAQNPSNVDHYRPKNGITVDKKKIENHKGYYWLGFEWTNLLPVCFNCNRKKSNQFPLKNGETSRISDDIEKEGFFKNDEFVIENFVIDKLNKEQRLLLNPEIDKVEKHLYFFLTGEIKALTEEGEKTIEVCDLNRSSLIYERKKIIDDIFRNLIELLVDDNYISLPKEIDKFLNKNLKYSVDLEYSRFRFFISEFFNYFIIDRLEELGFIEYAKILDNQYKKKFKT